MNDRTTKVARGAGRHPRAKSFMRDDTHMVQQIQQDEYVKGCKWACWALVGMFITLLAGTAAFGW